MAAALRGFYPGGGGDYYTHYFYYYLAVIQNHGLAPNDVWYHYYYSKGSGLAFLGMLLSDPEAPALTTYACVASPPWRSHAGGADGAQFAVARRGRLVYLFFI